MNTTVSHPRRVYDPGFLCRTPPTLVNMISTNHRLGQLLASAYLTIAIGAFSYGYVFGAWRAPLQGLYSAIKLPALMFSVNFCSAMINTMLAQLFGSGLTFRQVPPQVRPGEPRLRRDASPYQIRSGVFR